ncbi:hypothetical protein Poly24_26180 [Rosistilla carotiformis]|uniref:Porin n=1 Tax=Rosistilla carotiformis TaxID=2528017 RepID=A0A518JTN5_9BACT|nr:porin [Rosistilla carotiformis]QDV68905.1 hypothetical protein Poly24_26180 [Rosistilla carotiformis]
MLRIIVPLALASLLPNAILHAQTPFQSIAQVGYAAQCDCGEAVCGCEGSCSEPTCGISEPAADCDSICDSGCDSMGGGLGCFDSSKTGCGLFSNCGGDPLSLFGCSPCGLTVSGWTQIGYHSKGSDFRFNSDPNNVQLQQAWLSIDKAIDTSEGFDIGGHIDYIYGTDGPDTQAFGTDNGHWDQSFDNGGNYGSAIPQAYVEMGYGDLSVKVGHFYTIIGWEVVTAPDNFFYSHAYTMYNSEPFTHTGALATLAVGDNASVFGGYTLGWDSGYEDNGDNFIGGISSALCDNITATYATVFGRFVERTQERGYMHSLVFDVTMTENFQYILQSDLLATENASGAAERESIGINQYWIYSINDCLSAGARFEWWNNLDSATGNRADVYDLTLGCNVTPHSNVIIRPEVRWDWDPDQLGVNQDGGKNQTTFGIDTIVLF